MANSKTPSPIDKDQLLSLMVRSDACGLIRIFQHTAAIAMSIVLISISESWTLQGPGIILLGVLLTFLFAPLHETIHKTAFDSSVLNEIVGWVSGLILILPPKYFQAFHMAHHRYTQIPGKDPELDSEKPTSTGQYVRHLTGMEYWSGQVKALILFAIGQHQVHFINDVKRPSIVKEARVFLSIYLILILISVISQSPILLKYWVLPMLIGQPCLRAFLLAEHSLCPEVTDMLQNTRTTLTNTVMHWICWNMSYHVEHHMHPAIPFHRLADTHTFLSPHIRVISAGYMNVHKDILKTF